MTNDAADPSNRSDGHPSAPPRFAFISYVRDDHDRVDQLQQTLEAAGIPVWRDTQDLWPGEDWPARIRQAITDNAMVFIACFSRASTSRAKSYQNHEFLLAVDQLKQQRPGTQWLIPVRLDDCELPDLDIGAGRTLRSLQSADLFGDRVEKNTARLVATILRSGNSPSRRDRNQLPRRCRRHLQLPVAARRLVLSARRLRRHQRPLDLERLLAADLG